MYYEAKVTYIEQKNNLKLAARVYSSFSPFINSGVKDKPPSYCMRQIYQSFMLGNS